MTKILLSVDGAQERDLQGAGTHSNEFSSPQLRPQGNSRASSFPQGAAALAQLETKVSPCPFHLLAPKQPRAGEAAQASPKPLWHSPRAQSRLLQHQSQIAAQAAFSILHTFIRFRAGQITKCTKWRPHYQKQDCGLQQHSYGPEAFGRSMERVGWVRGLLQPTAFQIARGQTLFTS